MNRSVVRWPALLFAALLVAACASNVRAPVVDRGAGSPRAAAPAPATSAGQYHTVRRGETLYSIALEYGQSYKDVAAWNGLNDANVIRVGQQLRVSPPEGIQVNPVAAPMPVESYGIGGEPTPVADSETVKRTPKGGKLPYSEQALAMSRDAALVPPPGPAASTAPTATPAQAPTPAAPVAAGTTGTSGSANWVWPSSGRLLGAYAEGSKGVDIEGHVGEPVLAAEAGKVTYAGSGIRGYGNLLIIQHADGLSSVYAHNSKLLAQEGQQVAKGQKIAELGDSDADQAKLHFEIRRQGKPLDPLKYLPPR